MTSSPFREFVNILLENAIRKIGEWGLRDLYPGRGVSRRCRLRRSEWIVEVGKGTKPGLFGALLDHPISNQIQTVN
jgi:hypothetical protein